MQINNFIRFSESIKTREDMRVVSVTIRPLITDCTGDIYFTDFQLQESSRLTGYTPHTTTMLKNSENLPKYFNAVVRSGNTLVLHTSGGTSTGLDCYVYPNQVMAAGSIKLSQGAGSHEAVFHSAANPGDEFALLALNKTIRKKLSIKGKEKVVTAIAIGYPDVHYKRTVPRKPANVQWLT